MKTPIPRAFPTDAAARQAESNAATSVRELAARALTSGRVVGFSRVTDGAVATGTTTVPLDDTPPLVNEGTQFITTDYTPKAAGNMLLVTAHLNFCASAAAFVIAALFLDSEGTARAVGMEMVSDANRTCQVMVPFEMTAPDTRPHRFTIRAGGNTASTITFNGRSTARLFGGRFTSFIEVVEVAA